MADREYKLVELTRHDLEALMEKVESRFGLTAIPWGIRPFRINPAFKDVFSWKDGGFWRLFEKHQGAIRKYEFIVGHPDNRDHRTAHFWIIVRIAENEYQLEPSSNYPTIALREMKAAPRSFDPFCRFMESEWGLELTEKQLKADVLRDYSQSISGADMRGTTEANMRDHDYDGALRNAGTLIESELRNACVSAGASQAQAQTGDALAVTAYNEASGCLSPPWPIAAQAHKGAQLLFQGFFAYVRNAYNHHATVMGECRENIVEFLKGCEWLLNIIKHSSRR